MCHKIIFIALLIVSTDSQNNEGDGCSINVNLQTGHLKHPQPLILTKTESGMSFLYPDDKKGNIKIDSQSKIYLACPGVDNSLSGIDILENDIQEIELECLTGQTFKLDIKDYDITNIKCKVSPHINTVATKEKCLPNTMYTKIGFSLKNGLFLHTIKVCYDPLEHQTYYTMHELTKTNGYHQTCGQKFRWYPGTFFGKFVMDILYKKNNQIESVAKISENGDQSRVEKYIVTNKTFLTRGHMSPKADFIYCNQKRSTFRFINAAPQWSTCNGGIWGKMEENIRTFVQNKSLNLDVYTGVHGIVKLSNGEDALSPLFLYNDGKQVFLPVPEYFWKIIYDRTLGFGTAFVVSNRLHRDSDPLCNDVSNEITWLTREFNKAACFFYACKIEDLRTAIPTLPDLEVNGLLL